MAIITAHRHAAHKHMPAKPNRTWLYMIAFFVVVAGFYGIEKRLEDTGNNIEIDYN